MFSRSNILAKSGQGLFGALIIRFMRLQFEILDGPQKGKKITLKKGLVIGRQMELLSFADSAMAEQHGVLDFDSKMSWYFECLAPAKALVGSKEQARISLIPGLIFHLGRTAFRVVEKENQIFESWQKGLIQWLRDNPGIQKDSEAFFFLNPVSLAFVQGPQSDEFVTLSYGPRFLGHGSLDIHLKDPQAPKKVGHFFQVADRCYIENLCGERATINSNFFDQHPIQDGDRLKINSTIIELSILK